MCKLKELVDFISEHYGYSKLYVHGTGFDFMVLSSDLPIPCYNYKVTAFKYSSIFNQLDVMVKEDKNNASEKKEIRE